MPVDVHIPRGQTHWFKDMLKDRQMSYVTRVRNLQRLVNMERMRPRSGGFDSKFHDYHKVSGSSSINVMCTLICRGRS